MEGEYTYLKGGLAAGSETFRVRPTDWGSLWTAQLALAWDGSRVEYQAEWRKDAQGRPFHMRLSLVRDGVTVQGEYDLFPSVAMAVIRRGQEAREQVIDLPEGYAVVVHPIASHDLLVGHLQRQKGRPQVLKTLYVDWLAPGEKALTVRRVDFPAEVVSLEEAVAVPAGRLRGMHVRLGEPQEGWFRSDGLCLRWLLRRQDGETWDFALTRLM